VWCASSRVERLLLADPELPVGALAGCENFSSHLFFKRRICNLWLQRLATLEWRWFKDAITRKDNTAFNVVLQLSDVPRPDVTNLVPA
jgi:hypothetical protein